MSLHAKMEILYFTALPLQAVCLIHSSLKVTRSMPVQQVLSVVLYRFYPVRRVSLDFRVDPARLMQQI